ncbi:unnamed protein product [Caenorhabditis angaria]|uniref:7TM GPCR serpentine receptor class x (Srx) domain-containing protein n=1 Tax=Caenorhabditis angaria TaxID=860376 RepID=A0A9P1J009_9PELO|nr:unnamed protein product [Caenorhabditis angaria]
MTLPVFSFLQEYTNNDLSNYYGVFIDDIAAFTFIYYDTKYRWKSICFIIFITLTMIVQNLIIFFCGLKIRAKLYNQKHRYSSALYKLHQQFFKTLVLQVTIPTLFIFIPVFLILYAPLIGVNLTVLSTNVFWLFYLYPAIDSFIVMYVITEYKSALKGMAT